MGAGDPGRPAADHGDALARARRAGEGVAPLLEQRIGGVALQPADRDGLAFLGETHAGGFAQHLGRADPGAAAAEDVGLQDGAAGARDIVGGDLADESRDVDAGGAGLDAGRVVAEIAAIGLDHRRLARQRRMDVGEMRAIGLGRKPPGGDVRLSAGTLFRHAPATLLMPRRSGGGPFPTLFRT